MRGDDTSAAVVLTNTIYQANDDLQEAKRKKDKEITAKQQAIDQSSSQNTEDESALSSEDKLKENQQLREELRRLKDEQAKLS
jgi:predicted  nucleic acid-binding Zn-ribbon protein